MPWPESAHALPWAFDIRAACHISTLGAFTGGTRMISRLASLAFASAFAALPALAQDAPTGDAEAGAKVFAKCHTCHVVADAAGAVLAGKNAKTGPNLYGLPGRTAGTYPEFKYGESIVALGATGFAWDEASFVEYTSDPAKFLKSKLDDKGAKSKMAFKLPKEEDAHNVWAFLVSLAPPAAETGAAEAPSN
jgi:cytochrome c